MPRGVNLVDDARLQGRNAVNANSFNIVSPGIVTDGLVLHLDAGNYQSYPIAGTTWYDLSDRRINGTIVNVNTTYSRTGGGSISFNGTPPRLTLTSPLISKRCTISYWVYQNSGNGYSSPFSIGDNSSRVENGSTDALPSTEYNHYWYSGGFSTNALLLYTSIAATFVFITLTFDSQYATCYKEAVQTAQDTSSNFSAGSTLYLGSRGTARGYNCLMPMFSVYDRALTPTEVQQNFNATRARFGI